MGSKLENITEIKNTLENYLPTCRKKMDLGTFSKFEVKVVLLMEIM